METWITRIALLWLDGSILLLAALVSVGPYALVLTGALLLMGRPHRCRRRQTPYTPSAPRFTVR